MQRLKGISARFSGIAYPALAPCYQKEGIQDSNHNLQIALNGMAPSYICDLLEVHHPNRNLRHGSASRGLSWSLVVPTHQTQAYSRCSFFLCSYTYSQKFDSFPVDIKNAQTLFLFKRKLKTFLFNQFLTFVKRAEIMQLRYYYYYHHEI